MPAAVRLEDAVASYLDWLDLGGRPSETLYAYGSDLALLRRMARHFKLEALEEVGERHLKALLGAERRAGRAEETVLRRAKVLRAFFGWAQRAGMIAANPAARLPVGRGRCQRITTPTTAAATVAALLDAPLAPGGRARRLAFRDAALLAVLFDTAMTATEAARLLDADLDTEARAVTIGRGTSREREVALGPRAAELVAYYRAEYRPSAAAPELFLSSGGRALSRHAVDEVFAIYSRDIGLARPLSVRALRTTRVRQLQADGATEATLRRVLGQRGAPCRWR